MKDIDLANCPLNRLTPFMITNVSMTQLSVARHFGGCVFQGEHYRYFAEVDALIRQDVVEWSDKISKVVRQEQKDKQIKLNEQKELI